MMDGLLKCFNIAGKALIIAGAIGLSLYALMILLYIVALFLGI